MEPCEWGFEWLLTLLAPLKLLPVVAALPLLLLTLTLGTWVEPGPTSVPDAPADVVAAATTELVGAVCGGGASLRGGMRSLMESKPLASSKEVIL